MKEDSDCVDHGERGYVCPADRTPERGKTRCYGGYWVPDPLFNILRLRDLVPAGLIISTKE